MLQRFALHIDTARSYLRVLKGKKLHMSSKMFPAHISTSHTAVKLIAVRSSRGNPGHSHVKIRRIKVPTTHVRTVAQPLLSTLQALDKQAVDPFAAAATTSRK